jgi:hypothetical protein
MGCNHRMESWNGILWWESRDLIIGCYHGMETLEWNHGMGSWNSNWDSLFCVGAPSPAGQLAWRGIRQRSRSSSTWTHSWSSSGAPGSSLSTASYPRYNKKNCNWIVLLLRNENVFLIIFCIVQLNIIIILFTHLFIAHCWAERSKGTGEQAERSRGRADRTQHSPH